MRFKKGEKQWNNENKLLTSRKQSIARNLKGGVPWNKGIKMNETFRRMRSSVMKQKAIDGTHNGIFKKGKENPSYGKKGKLSVNYGRKHSEETKEKISKSKVGGSSWWKGKQLSEEHRKKLSESHKNYKMPHSQKQKISIALKGRFLGEDSSRWNGGTSFEPYTLDFNEQFKESIRERDNRSCVVCNKMEEDELKERRWKLSIHHIDYIKINTFPQNCIALCHCCHNKTLINRPHWTTFFQSLLKELYQYEYTEDQKIILDFTKGDTK